MKIGVDFSEGPDVSVMLAIQCESRNPITLRVLKSRVVKPGQRMTFCISDLYAGSEVTHYTPPGCMRVWDEVLT